MKYVQRRVYPCARLVSHDTMTYFQHAGIRRVPGTCGGYMCMLANKHIELCVELAQDADADAY